MILVDIFSLTNLLTDSFRYTFVDLAQIVCKLPETYPEREEFSSDDEYYGGYASEPSTMPNPRLRKIRAGGSLSLSENEFDSDEDEYEDEMPVPFRVRSSSTSESTRSPDSSEAMSLPKKLNEFEIDAQFSKQDTQKTNEAKET